MKLHYCDCSDKYLEKTDRKKFVSNFLETSEQSKVSSLGGATLSASPDVKEEDRGAKVLTTFAGNAGSLILPVAVTMLCGTVTYPIAVRIARRVFKLRGFYAIHLSIAPFLALAHVNIFGVAQAYCWIKLMETEFEHLKPQLAREGKLENPYKTYESVRQIKVADHSSAFHQQARGTKRRADKWVYGDEASETKQLLNELKEQDANMAYEIR